MNKPQIKTVVRNANIPAVLRHLLPEGQLEGDDWVALNITRDDKELGSFRIDVNTGKAIDFASGQWQGDIVGVVAMVQALSQSAAAQWLIDNRYSSLDTTQPAAKKPAVKKPVKKGLKHRPKNHPALGSPVASWEYRDVNDQLICVQNRFNTATGKTYRPLYRNPNDGLWYWQAPPEPRPLYGLIHLTNDPAAPVGICEGEKAADAMQELFPDMVAIASLNGAESPNKTDWSPLANRDIRIWPDNDAAGKEYAKSVFLILQSLGVKSVKILAPQAKSLPDKYDAADAFTDNWRPDESDWIDAGIYFANATPAPAVNSGQASTIPSPLNGNNVLGKANPIPAVNSELPPVENSLKGSFFRGGDLNLDPYRGTDQGNANLFLARYGHDVLYCPNWQQWLTYDGTTWLIDDGLRVKQLAAGVANDLYKIAGDQFAIAGQLAAQLGSDQGDDDANKQVTAAAKQAKKIFALANKLELARHRANMLLTAQHDVVIRHSELDCDHYLLNCTNGTIDLRTGNLRQHDRVDRITHNVGIVYDPNATAPLWDQFMQDVFQQDHELIRFIRKAVGYSLTGDVSAQVLFICHGAGSNGKSVLINVLRHILGDLAHAAAPDLLMADRNRRHPTEQASLFGKRFVVCQETESGRRFDESLVKRLTGGDAITARRMNEDFWEFNPTHKLWLSTNHKPVIKGTDYAIWRRMMLIPFNATFNNDSNPPRDPMMESKLLNELPGILNWAIRGCIEWQQSGLTPPSSVAKATSEYQSEMDTLAAWLSECCEQGNWAECKSSDLYRSYSDWCAREGERPQSQRKWGLQLTERGFTRQARRNGIYYNGLGLKTDCAVEYPVND